MKKLIVAVFISLVCAVSMYAEPTIESPLNPGDNISILKNGRTIYSYTYGKDKTMDDEFDDWYNSLSSFRYKICNKYLFDLEKKITDSDNYIVEDSMLKVQKKNRITYITCKYFSPYTIKLSGTVDFTTFCMFY